MTSRVKGALAVRSSKPWSTTVEVARPPSYEAYLEFLQGVAVHGMGTYQQAERHFRRALELDPGYVEPRGWLLNALTNQGKPAEADEVLRPAEEPTAFGEATPAEQAAIRYIRAELDGNLRGGLAAASDYARLAPFLESFFGLGRAESRNNHPRAALASLSRIRVEDAPAASGPNAFSFLSLRAAQYHQVGEDHKQLEDARLGQKHTQAPASAFFLPGGGCAGCAGPRRRASKASSPAANKPWELEQHRQSPAPGRRRTGGARACRPGARDGRRAVEYYEKRLKTESRPTISAVSTPALCFAQATAGRLCRFAATSRG